MFYFDDLYGSIYGQHQMAMFTNSFKNLFKLVHFQVLRFSIAYYKYISLLLRKKCIQIIFRKSMQFKII